MQADYHAKSNSYTFYTGLTPELTELDDEYEITATVVDTEQLSWWLRGFGEAVKNVQKQPL